MNPAIGIRLTNWLHSPLLRNTSWMLASEGMSRATRLITIITLAAYLSSADYGTAMLALACHEILRVLMRAGAGPKVIQCAESELPLIASNAASLQWLICLGLGAIQCVVAHSIAVFYHNEQLTLLLQIMALSYVFYPLVSVRVFMLQRTHQIRYFSLRNGICVMFENLGCALMLYAGFGIAAVAYAKIISAAAWAVCFYAAPVKNFGFGLHAATLLSLSRYSGSILGTELMRTLRSQVDMIIAGRLLSPELLGIYSFAKSAGVGLSQSLSTAYLSVLYPHICKQQRNQNSSFKHAPIFVLSSAIALLFLLQALIAPFYIEWLFAAHWHHSAALVSVLCLSAIPALLIDTECNLLRAQTRINHEFFICTFCVAVSTAGLLLINPTTPMQFATAVALTSVLWLSSFIHRAIPFLSTSFKRAYV